MMDHLAHAHLADATPATGDLAWSALPHAPQVQPTPVGLRVRLAAALHGLADVVQPSPPAVTEPSTARPRVAHAAVEVRC